MLIILLILVLKLEINGGEVIAQGSSKEISENKDSITGKYLSNKFKINVPQKKEGWQKMEDF